MVMKSSNNIVYTEVLNFTPHGLCIVEKTSTKSCVREHQLEGSPYSCLKVQHYMLQTSVSRQQRFHCLQNLLMSIHTAHNTSNSCIAINPSHSLLHHSDQC